MVVVGAIGDNLEYPFKAGHPIVSITYHKSLLALPRPRQLINLYPDASSDSTPLKPTCSQSAHEARAAQSSKNDKNVTTT